MAADGRPIRDGDPRDTAGRAPKEYSLFSSCPGSVYSSNLLGRWAAHNSFAGVGVSHRPAFALRWQI